MQKAFSHHPVIYELHTHTMSAPQVNSPLEDKHNDLHVEDVTQTRDGGDISTDPDELVKSRYDQLSVFQALWKFRRATFYTFLVFTGYTIDGFEVSVDDPALLTSR
jgi:hypothetical protein